MDIIEWNMVDKSKLSPSFTFQMGIIIALTIQGKNSCISLEQDRLKTLAVVVVYICFFAETTWPKYCLGATLLFQSHTNFSH